MAVSAFSPPDSSITLCRRLPGGCATMSMPLSSGSDSSSSMMPALPPPNSVENVAWKFVVDRGERFAEARVRRFVDLADRLVGLRDRVDEVLVLRGQEDVALLELLRLLDRHHVDRAHALDLFAQLGDRLFRGHLDRFDAVRPVRNAVRAGVGRLRRPVFDLVRIDGFSGANGAHVGLHLAGRLHLRHFIADLVEGRVDGVDRLLREVRQVGFGGRALHVHFRGERAQRIDGAAGIANGVFLLLGRLLDLERALVGAHHLLRRPSSLPTSSSISRWPSTIACSSRSRWSRISATSRVHDSTRRSRSAAISSRRDTSASAAALRSTRPA